MGHTSGITDLYLYINDLFNTFFLSQNCLLFVLYFHVGAIYITHTVNGSGVVFTWRDFPGFFFALYKINLSTILLWIIRKTNISFIYFIKIHLQVLLTMEKADLCVVI